jgi:hypothetical protein
MAENDEGPRRYRRSCSALDNAPKTRVLLAPQPCRRCLPGSGRGERLMEQNPSPPGTGDAISSLVATDHPISRVSRVWIGLGILLSLAQVPVSRTNSPMSRGPHTPGGPNADNPRVQTRAGSLLPERTILIAPVISSDVSLARFCAHGNIAWGTKPANHPQKSAARRDQRRRNLRPAQERDRQGPRSIRCQGFGDLGFGSCKLGQPSQAF